MQIKISSGPANDCVSNKTLLDKEFFIQFGP